MPGKKSVGNVLYINDSVESSPASAQGDVHLELDVHKDETTNEADGDDDQLGPERPLQITCKETYCISIYIFIFYKHTLL